jgi:Fe(3+) dicitrate transport protein
MRIDVPVMFRLGALCLGFSAAVLPVLARSTEVETIVVTGSILQDRTHRPGSAFVVSSQDLERLRPVSVGDVLRQVPGVQVVSEDLFGLKVNISVRGLTPRRSARTLLLEDGMPIQPAPYSEPSAHYVPPSERIDRIEVLKGSGEILHGPQSLGGMINFRTRPVPEAFEGQVSLATGTRGFSSGHLMLGAGNEKGGVRLDALQKQSDGIREGHATRFTDLALKAVVRLDDQQSLAVRFSHFVEDTALSEAGLDAARYQGNPFFNPFPSDHFDLTRSAVQVSYHGVWSDRLRLFTQIYAADTFRASYRQTDTSTDTMTANPGAGCEGSARLDYEGFASRCGNKMRPRQFFFAGLETTISIQTVLWGREVTTLIGGRLHHEDADRRRYNGLTPDAREASPGTLLRDWNVIRTDAVSAYTLSSVQLGALGLSFGVRHEDIQTTNTSQVANFVSRGVQASSDQSVTLPGVGFTWRGIKGVDVFGGIHRGFAPPRPDRDVDPLAPANQVRPEESTNYELGIRANLGPSTQMEATAFWLDFQELIVAGPLLGLASGTLVNAGQATHAGAELYIRHEGSREIFANWKPWATLSATYLAKAEFDSQVGEGAANVQGNRIPYAPEWLWGLSFGVTGSKGRGLSLGLHHVGQQFADARNTIAQSADGTLGLVPAYNLVNLGLTYRPPSRSEHAAWEIYFTVHNLLDRRYLSTRTDGMFAGSPRQAVLGIQKRF